MNIWPRTFRFKKYCVAAVDRDTGDLGKIYGPFSSEQKAFDYTENIIGDLPETYLLIIKPMWGGE